MSTRGSNKSAVNGYSLFRQQVLLDMRQQRKYLPAPEIDAITAERWETLDAEAKTEWRNRAKNVKYQNRLDRHSTDMFNEAAVQDQGSPFNTTTATNGAENEFLSAKSTRQNDASSPVNLAGLSLDPASHFGFRPNESPASSASVHPAGSSALEIDDDQAPYLRTKQQLPSNVDVTSQQRQPKVKQTGVSAVKALEETKLGQDPMKFRSKIRENYVTSFVWHYSDDPKLLKGKSFYFIACQLLYQDKIDPKVIVPAELCISEFTVSSGISNFYCVPVKPEDVSNLNRRVVDSAAHITHGYDLMYLLSKGKTCQEIAKHLLAMVHNREPHCEKKFFAPAAQFDAVCATLNYIFSNSGAETNRRKFSMKNVGYLDDLAYGLFKFFDVDFSAAPSLENSTPIDLHFINNAFNIRDEKPFLLIDFACDAHAEMSDGAEAWCCMYRHYFWVEMFASSIANKNFSPEHMKRFIDYGNTKHGDVITSGAQGAAPPESPMATPVELPATGNVEEGLPISPATNNLNGSVDDDDFSFDSSRAVAPGQKRAAMPAPPAPMATRQQQMDDSSSFDEIRSRSPTSSVQSRGGASRSASTITRMTMAPSETLDVQNKLPSGAKGIGRGLHLMPDFHILKMLRSSQNC